MGGCINTIIICWKGHSEAHSVVNTMVIVILSYLFLSQLLLLLLLLELFLTRKILNYQRNIKERFFKKEYDSYIS